MAGVGGYQPPANPAPVSGPGALSARTDGQPVRVAPGGKYGDRKALVSQQQAAPMAGPPAQPTGSPPGGGGVRPPDLFAPTARPGEPITAGIPMGPGPSGGMLPDDPDAIIKAMIEVTGGHPDIVALLRGA